MGAQQSTPQLTLAEKRYRIGSPDAGKKRKKNVKKKSTSTSALASATAEAGTSTSIASAPANGSRRMRNSMASDSSSESQSSGSIVPIPRPRLKMEQFLTRTHRLLIENSWKRSRKSGADNSGTKIFQLILTAQPDIKMIFGLEKIPQGTLKYDPRFRKHAVVFTRTLDYVIKNITYPEKIIQHFEALGRRHIQFQGRGFLPQYWETFAECMTQAAIEWERGHRCRDTMIAWRQLVGFIIKQMRTGFDEENQIRKKFHSNSFRQGIGSRQSSQGSQIIAQCPIPADVVLPEEEPGYIAPGPVPTPARLCPMGASPYHHRGLPHRAASQQCLRRVPPEASVDRHSICDQEEIDAITRNMDQMEPFRKESTPTPATPSRYYTPPSTRRSPIPMTPTGSVMDGPMSPMSFVGFDNSDAEDTLNFWQTTHAACSQAARVRKERAACT